jgi:hypothetical protein
MRAAGSGAGQLAPAAAEELEVAAVAAGSKLCCRCRAGGRMG